MGIDLLGFGIFGLDFLAGVIVAADGGAFFLGVAAFFWVLQLSFWVKVLLLLLLLLLLRLRDIRLWRLLVESDHLL
jgi:hypothetical protein